VVEEEDFGGNVCGYICCLHVLIAVLVSLDPAFGRVCVCARGCVCKSKVSVCAGGGGAGLCACVSVPVCTGAPPIMCI
jgi:hypothetical protein